MDLTLSELELLSKIKEESSKYKKRMAICASLVFLLACGCVYYAFDLRAKWNDFAQIPQFEQRPDYNTMEENYGRLLHNSQVAVDKATAAFIAGGLLYFCSILMILLAVSMLRAAIDRKKRTALLLRLVERLELLRELNPPYTTY